MNVSTLRYSGSVECRAANDPSVFTIMEKAPTRASWLKAPTRAFTFKTQLRPYAKYAPNKYRHSK